MAEKNDIVVKISVRELVEFLLREGDIDNRIGTGKDPEVMQMGSQIHRKIQKRMGGGYRAEVSLVEEIPLDGFSVLVEGRADGIFEQDGQTIIDEIKGVLWDLSTLEEPKKVHLAQAKCYAYIYAKRMEMEKIGVQMTYCQMETEEIKRFHEAYSFAELKEWFCQLIRQYEKWARFQIEWREKRNRSIKMVEFPYDYRKGQKELAASVYRSILREKKLFIQAPTGVGKTIATVFPAVKAMGEELAEKLFYLTARTITRTVAEQTFEKFKEQGLQMKVISLTAKEKICFCEKPDCNPESCPYAKGHFDRVNEAVYELLKNEDSMDREKLEDHARKFRVCPFEMMLDASLWADAIICDYNYVFDPNAYLRRFFAEGVNGKYIFLVDEAHNLVERGRNMYSAELYKEDILAVKKLVKEGAPRLAKQLDEINKWMLERKKECENYEIQENIATIYLKLVRALSLLDEYLEECEMGEDRDTVLDLYFAIRFFLEIYEGMDENYVVYTEYQTDGRFMLRLFCVNPANKLQEYLQKGKSTIFFSATFLPIQYYKKLLSTKSDDYAIYVESLFDPQNRLLLNGIDVSTKYTKRSRGMYEKYARYIYETVQAKGGNYLAFFPSYQFMEEVYEAFELTVTAEDRIDWICQGRSMNEESREIFLENFEETREGSLVGFCVMGGIFSEGIDLTEERLIGALIVGTGLPQVCSEREILCNYFDAQGMQGFDYAYLYPGMNKVLQAAGRVIRTENDQGVILLLDDRFRDRRCRETFPREWSDVKTCRLQNVKKEMEDFWKKRAEKARDT